MSTTTFLQALGASALAVSGALVLVMAMRLPIRRMAGPRVAYGLWCVPLLAALASVLPLPQGTVGLPIVVRWPLVLAETAPVLAINAGAPVPAAMDMAALLVGIYLAGVFVMAGLLWICQRRFRMALGPLHKLENGLWQASTSAGLPAVVGVPPRLVLPMDFQTRFTGAERRLALAHESVHLRRGDAFANAAAACLHCLLWFNPLLWLALARYRVDQELACDAAVLQDAPNAHRDYAEALLKTQLPACNAPLLCQWSGHHPLKERIQMLYSPPVSRSKALAGSCLIILAAGAVTWGAWAAQPTTATGTAPATTHFVASSDARYVDMKIGGLSAKESGEARLIARPGEQFRISQGQTPDKGVGVSGTAAVMPDKGIALELTQIIDGQPHGKPVHVTVQDGVPTPVLLGGSKRTELVIDASSKPERYQALLAVLEQAAPPGSVLSAVSSGPGVVTLQALEKPIRDVAAAVADASQTRISNPDLLPTSRNVTLSFNKVSVDAVMTILAEEAHAKVSRSGNTFTFSAVDKR